MHRLFAKNKRNLDEEKLNRYNQISDKFTQYLLVHEKKGIVIDRIVRIIKEETLQHSQALKQWSEMFNRINQERFNPPLESNDDIESIKRELNELMNKDIANGKIKASEPMQAKKTFKSKHHPSMG